MSLNFRCLPDFKLHFQPVRELCLLILLVGLSSCGSLRLTYLGKIPRHNGIIYSKEQFLFLYNSEKKRIQLDEDSLLREIEIHKKNKNYLTAKDLNHLYSSFGDQLDVDRYYSSLLANDKSKRDSLTSLQAYAAASLLASARWYLDSLAVNPSIRRALNRGDKGNYIPRNILNKCDKFLYSYPLRSRLGKARHDSKYPTDSLLKKLPQTNILKSLFRPVIHFPERIGSATVNFIQSIGKVAFSRNSEPEPVQLSDIAKAKILLSKLEPYDIVLEKSSDFIKNQIIPGYFTHASIWLGFRNRLKYNYRPALHFKGKQSTINDRAMIEAITTGVRLSNLKECVQGKTYAVIRFKPLSSSQKEAILKIALKQLRKTYDFNFDIQSSDVVNCTELVYLCYDFVSWQTRNYLGTLTLFPDDLLNTALENDNFEIVAILKDGKLIEHPDVILTRQLLKE